MRLGDSGLDYCGGWGRLGESGGGGLGGGEERGWGRRGGQLFPAELVGSGGGRFEQ